MSGLSQQKEEVTGLWTLLRRGSLRACVVGSGNWGTAVAKIVAQNAKDSYLFEDRVRMYVYEEMYQGQKLSKVINETHENVKYLPGTKLPSNLEAVPSLKEACEGAHLLVFVQPHQFIERSCRTIKKQCSLPEGAKAISLVKGFGAIDEGRGGLNLVSAVISDILGIECCALSGANVAKEVGMEQFAESTIGYKDQETGAIFQQLFDRPYFKVNCVQGVAPVELCGALKNVVALAAGFCDGLKLGTNTKAAIIRLGLLEIRRFAKLFYPEDTTSDDPFWDSCGVADLITTCFGGRNRKCAEAFVTSGMGWDQIEQKLLNGQKLQGTLTAVDIANFLFAKKAIDQFPLFHTVYQVVVREVQPSSVVTKFMTSEPRKIAAARL